MKKYTHAWLAFKAIERLEKSSFSESDQKSASSLINWFKSHKDGVINGAWYPDSIIKDNANSHVKKFAPAPAGNTAFRSLPSVMGSSVLGKKSALWEKPFAVVPGDNLPERCEALAHSVIDNLRIQETEEKGSSVSPTDNHIALILFMLSHYVADAHMPLHCDQRKFSDGINLHAKMEGCWEQEIKNIYEIDYANERYIYNRDSYPFLKSQAEYDQSYLKTVDDNLNQRRFVLDWGKGNSSALEYMDAVCQYSYLLSYSFVPEPYNEMNVTSDNWRTLEGQSPPFEALSVVVLSDAIDSIARVWFHVWRRYVQWFDNNKIAP